MSPPVEAQEQQRVAKVIQLIGLKDDFRKALAQDAAKAINDHAQDLGFDSSKLKQESLDALESITDPEYEALSKVIRKLSDRGIEISNFPF